MEEIKEWKGFDDGIWRDKIDVRDFIINNYTKYEGDDSFLKGPTEKTKKLWEIVSKLLKEETKLKFYDSKMIFWGEALRTLNDSLKNEQIRMKMINDSIKSAAKHIK